MPKANARRDPPASPTSLPGTKSRNRAPARKVTAIDVARVAGVSQSTVSRTFSPDASIAPETRRRVMESARELGYNPNAIARSLITNRTNIIGIVMSQITSPFYPYVLEQMIQHLGMGGRQALLFNAGPDRPVDDVLPLALQYRVDGLIITSATITSETAALCARQGTPVVLFNRYILGANVSAVCCDNEAGGRLIADQFADGGAQRPAYIAGIEDTSTNRDRQKGYVDRLRERGYADAAILHEPGAYTYESGYAAAAHLFRRDDRPDAIFCANDIMALGAMDAARHEFGLRVPDEVQIIGFDDIPSAAWASYALTTIQQPVQAMIARTVELLTAHIENPDAPATLELLPGTFIRRQSSR